MHKNTRVMDDFFAGRETVAVILYLLDYKLVLPIYRRQPHQAQGNYAMRQVVCQISILDAGYSMLVNHKL